MKIIIAESGVEEELDSLIEQYGVAKSQSEQELIAGQIYTLIGGKIRSMIAHAAKDRQLSEEQKSSLAWEALFRGLNESGMPRFRLQSSAGSDWQPQIQKMISAVRTHEPSAAARIWSMLSESTRSAILSNPTYIRSKIQNQFLGELNAFLRRRDLYSSRLWHKDSLHFDSQSLLEQGTENLSAMQLAKLNSELIASAFSDVDLPEQPERNLLGYISKIVQQMKPQIWESATGRKPDAALTEAWVVLKNDVAAVEQMQATGQLPDEWSSLSFPQQIYQHYRQRLSVRYSPIIGWWNGKIRELMPQRPFVIHGPASLRAAKELLEKASVPDQLWRKQGSPYFLPASVLQPYGLGMIERLLSTEGFRSPSAPAQQAPAKPESVSPARLDSEDLQLLQGGHQSPAFRWLIEKLYPSPGFEAERAVGVFLADLPNPSNQQIQQFIASLPDDLAEQIEAVGFRNLARQLDVRVLTEIKKPEVRKELLSELGKHSAVWAAVNGIRRVVFCRTATLICSRFHAAR